MLPWSISLMGGCMHSCRDFFLGLFCWCLSQTRDLSWLLAAGGGIQGGVRAFFGANPEARPACTCWRDTL